MATTTERLAALEAAVFGAPPADAPAEPLPVVATVTVGDKSYTTTAGTEADLRDLIAAKEK